jgi:glycosyltransferase involved in cell wall biosynthesis
VRNGVSKIEEVVESVLAQDHANIELVISDNCSTDGTEDLCRSLARNDQRVVYVRQKTDVGIMANYHNVIVHSRGPFFRWISDGDRLMPDYVSRCLAAFADPRVTLVTSRISYRSSDGTVFVPPYDGVGLDSPDRISRFDAALKRLTAGPGFDPMYGLVRRVPVAALERRDFLREDEVFGVRLALLGEWRHVPAVLASRTWDFEPPRALARKLRVPAWQTHVFRLRQCYELLVCLRELDLTVEEQRRARAAVLGLYLRRHQARLRSARKRALGAVSRTLGTSAGT